MVLTKVWQRGRQEPKLNNKSMWNKKQEWVINGNAEQERPVTRSCNMQVVKDCEALSFSIEFSVAYNRVWVMLSTLHVPLKTHIWTQVYFKKRAFSCYFGKKDTFKSMSATSINISFMQGHMSWRSIECPATPGKPSSLRQDVLVYFWLAWFT